MLSLSNTEEIIMHAIWTSERDIAAQYLIHKLNDRYGKDYARTTVLTFVDRIERKGYLSTYRKGRLSYITPSISLEEYRTTLIKSACTLFFHDNRIEMIQSLLTEQELSSEEKEKLREYL